MGSHTAVLNPFEVTRYLYWSLTASGLQGLKRLTEAFSIETPMAQSHCDARCDVSAGIDDNSSGLFTRCGHDGE
jgi:hypothetical protein